MIFGTIISSPVYHTRLLSWLCIDHHKMAAQTTVPVLQPWALARLRNVVSIHPGVRFEASIYGPLLLLLFTIFPPIKQFITKPQGLLRPPLEAGGDILADINNTDSDDEEKQVHEEPPYDDDVEYGVEPESENVPEETVSEEDTSTEDEDFIMEDGEEEGLPEFGGDVSMDSYNCPTASRNVKGSYKHTSFADFLVAKGGESLTGDKLVLVVEVKKNRTNRRDARYQIQRYLIQSRRKNRDAHLVGILVLGQRTEAYTLSGPGDDAVVNAGLVYDTTSESLCNLLHGIAVAYA
ncbi:hypothetical protein BDQ12DRAFT_735746 [Crucibulum laeve]|uniref:Uncharacterized protein n=1 Tax=Crucibulum laeve TaxID=68775 RepID=A0A5C3LZ56_9AGAR|nr:hypothetical protein BDQ12DRAFT_735746 [Crucibulum laeve]